MRIYGIDFHWFTKNVRNGLVKHTLPKNQGHLISLKALSDLKILNKILQYWFFSIGVTY